MEYTRYSDNLDKYESYAVESMNRKILDHYLIAKYGMTPMQIGLEYGVRLKSTQRWIASMGLYYSGSSIPGVVKNKDGYYTSYHYDFNLATPEICSFDNTIMLNYTLKIGYSIYKPIPFLLNVGFGFYFDSSYKVYKADRDYDTDSGWGDDIAKGEYFYFWDEGGFSKIKTYYPFNIGIGVPLADILYINIDYTYINKRVNGIVFGLGVLWK